MALRAALDRLVRREDLAWDEASAAMEQIAAGEGHAAQIGAFLALLAAKGETADEIAALARVMGSHAVRVELPGPVLDIVGTGGDGHNTVNISTSAAILAAACGATVAKHGSKSVTSKSGSSDVLQRLGIALLGPDHIAPCIQAAGIAFMFAPNFHPAMKHVVPIRQALGMRTVFNILGPLLNPAGAKRLMLGVYSLDLLDTFGSVVHKLGAEHALIVHCCGLDELAAVGVADAVEVTKDGGPKRIKIDPQAMGIPQCTIKDLEGGEPAENAEIIRSVFAGGEAASGAIGNTIALNTGAALYVYGLADSVEAGFRMASDKLKSGDALATLETFASVSTSLENGEPLLKNTRMGETA